MRVLKWTDQYNFTKVVLVIGNCRNMVDDCMQLGYDKCTHHKDYWVAYMKKHCRKYCNFC